MSTHPLLTGLALCAFGLALPAQGVGDLPPPGDAHQQLLLTYRSFDPLTEVPALPATLQATGSSRLWLLQFRDLPTEAARQQVLDLGAEIHTYMPHRAYVVRMGRQQALAAAQLPTVRWVGPYHPAYRLEPLLVAEHLAGWPAPERRYNLLVVDKRRDKPALAAQLIALGGEVVDEQPDSVLFVADLDPLELVAAAHLDEVLWIDRWSPPEDDMNNARAQGGGNYVEAAGGYTGAGIRGHVYEGVQSNHPDFNTTMTVVLSCTSATDHGHCTAGIVFGNGSSHPFARGMAPNARGYYTNYNCVTTGWSRNGVIGVVVNSYGCMFTTSSWGTGLTTAYTSVSADADDIVFDHRIPWTTSQSNTGNRDSRPEAWAKNVFSIGAVQHFDNADPGDDSWAAGSASIGPAADGRIKPDLCAYYDAILTSDRTGTAGYTNLNYTTSFGGTSGATPIVAGHNALAIQMFTDLIFGNAPRVPGGSRFQNRPYAQTLKALMIASASQYPFTSSSTDNRREHQGWGFPDLRYLYDLRSRTMVVDEDSVLVQGQVREYRIRVEPGESQLKICMTYLDPMGNPAASIARINDLNLKVIAPDGTTYWGNHGLTTGRWSVDGGSPDTRDTVECVFVSSPQAGDWRIDVLGSEIVQDAHVATGAVDATFALVAIGGRQSPFVPCSRFVHSADPTLGAANYIPFGQVSRFDATTTFASNNGGSTGGAVYFELTPAQSVEIHRLSLNVNATAGAPITVRVYRTAAGVTYAGNETNPSAWTLVSTGHGVAADPDQPSLLVLDPPFSLGTSSHGIALVAGGFGHRYTSTANTITDGQLTLQLGSATNTPFAGIPFVPRTANLIVHHRTLGGSWTNQRYQTVVRRGDLGWSGTITGLAFAPAATGMHWNSSLTVRMSHVPAGWALSDTFSQNLPNPVTVLGTSDHWWPVTGEQWNEIGLTNTFAYDVRYDLVVDIVAMGNDMSAAPEGFHRVETGDQPRVYAYGWTGRVPATASGNDDAGTKIRLQFGCADGSVYGKSCGRMRAGVVGQPILGEEYGFSVSFARGRSAVFLNLGLDNGPPLYPWNLSALGYTDCYFWHDILTTVGATANTLGSASIRYTVPNSSSLVGLRLYGQWLQPNSSLPGGWSFSNYARALHGRLP
jgi:hypothetical protein